MQRMKRTCPPVYNIAIKEPMSYKCPPKLRCDNIPGAFRPPMIPVGLWSNRGTVTNRMQGTEFFCSCYLLLINWFNIWLVFVADIALTVIG